MALGPKELNFKFYLILINLNITCETWLVAVELDGATMSRASFGPWLLSSHVLSTQRAWHRPGHTAGLRLTLLCVSHAASSQFTPVCSGGSCCPVPTGPRSQGLWTCLSLGMMEETWVLVPTHCRLCGALGFSASPPWQNRA